MMSGSDASDSRSGERASDSASSRNRPPTVPYGAAVCGGFTGTNEPSRMGAYPTRYAAEPLGNPLSRLASQLQRLELKAVASGTARSAAHDEPYKSAYCERGLVHSVYRTLPMRNELDQYMEIAAKRRRKGRTPFVGAYFPGGQNWLRREKDARLSSDRSGPGGGQSVLTPPKASAKRAPLPGLARLTSFAEIERQKTVTYDLQSKLKDMLSHK